MTTQTKRKHTGIKKVWNVLTHTAITAALFGSLSIYPENAQAALVDSEPPKFIQALLSSPDTVQLVYDEPVNTTHLSNSTYQVVNTAPNNTTADIIKITHDNNVVSLTLDRAFTSSDTLTLSYTPDFTHYLSDLAFNPEMEPKSWDVTDNTNDTEGPHLYSDEVSTPFILRNTLTLVYNEPLDTTHLPTNSTAIATLKSLWEIEGDGISVTANSFHIEGSIVTIDLAQAATVNDRVKLVGDIPFQDASGNLAHNDSYRVRNLTPSQLIEQPGGITVSDDTITLTYDSPVIRSRPLEGEPERPLEKVYTVLDHGQPIDVTEAQTPESENVILTLSKPVKNGQDVKVIYDPTNADEHIENWKDVPVESFTEWATDETKPEITQASALGDKLTLTFDEEVQATTNSDASYHFDSSHYVVHSNRPNSIQVTGYDQPATDKTQITLTLSRPVEYGEELSLTLDSPAFFEFEDYAKNHVKQQALPPVNNRTSPPYVPPADTTAPSLTGAEVNGSTLTLTYDELLRASSVPETGAYTVNVNGETIPVTAVSITGSTVTLTLVSPVQYGQRVQLSYAGSSTPVQDRAANPAATLSLYPVLNQTADTQAPVLQSAAVTGDILTLTYNEALNPASVPNSDAYTVNVDGKAIPVNTVSITGSTVTLTLASPVQYGQSVHVSYVDSSAPVQDMATNPAATLSLHPVLNQTVDTQAPILQNTVASNDTITLTYSEKLDPKSVPPSSSYLIQTEQGTIPVEAIKLEDTVVTLKLARPLESGEPVTLNYAVPVQMPLQDVAGNRASNVQTIHVLNQTIDNDTQGITLDQSTYVIPVNGIYNIQVTAHSTDGHTKDVTRLATYAASDSAIAEFASKNKAIGTKAGETDIHVSYSGKTAIVHLKVLSPTDYKAFARKQIDPNNKGISLGDIIKFIKSEDDTNRDGLFDQNDVQYVLEFIDPKNLKR